MEIFLEFFESIVLFIRRGRERKREKGRQRQKKNDRQSLLCSNLLLFLWWICRLMSIFYSFECPILPNSELIQANRLTSSRNSRTSKINYNLFNGGCFLSTIHTILYVICGRKILLIQLFFPIETINIVYLYAIVCLIVYRIQKD